MKQIVVLFCAIILAGCASVNDTYAPDGRKAYALNCSGHARGWDKCMKAAGDLCGSAGYDILDRGSEDSAIMIAGVNGQNGNAVGGRSSERSMLVACKKQ